MSVQALNSSPIARTPGGGQSQSGASSTGGTPAGLLAQLQDTQSLLSEVAQNPCVGGLLGVQGALQQFNVQSMSQATREKVGADVCKGVIERFA